ncbi:hypothetical protein [Chryseobacterium aureum]|uniref:hypothetical protein n=1 Tax=Chryseobacterium aureum TaxID=2497456 RepID=UPI000F865292|nr:hypothetical protein [Chryseobacterium aureum]
MKNIFNVLIVPVFLFCSFQKKNDESQNRKTDSEAQAKKSDRIIYLFFKAAKDQAGNAKVTLQSSKVADGRLKQAPAFERNNIHKGDLIISLTGSNGKEVAQQLVKDPFNPEMEVYEKEGITRHKATFQNTEFSTRFSYSENVQMVKVERATEDGVQLLFTQKL